MLQSKVRALYDKVRESFYLCQDDLKVGGQAFNAALLFGALTELNRGNQLLFGEYGGGKTTSAEYLHSLFNALPLDLVRRVVVRADPQKTDEKMVARPHYGKLFAAEEEVVWQHFVLVGPKIIDEFNRLPESNQAIMLNGVDRGEWQYLNESVTTGPQPLFATCNYADSGNNALIPPLLDRFDVAVESKYCGVAAEDAISEDFDDDKDEVLLARDTTRSLLERLAEARGFQQASESVSAASEEFSARLSSAGVPVLSEREKELARQQIRAVPLERDAQLYFLFLCAELNVSSKFGMKRSIDPLDKEAGRYLGCAFKGSGSRRASKAIKRYARSLAWLTQSTHVTLDHVLAVAPYVLWHRISWGQEAEREFKEGARDDPLSLHVTKRLCAQGSEALPGVLSRYRESKDNYQRVLDLVKAGERAQAEHHLRQCVSASKGHPVFVDAQRSLGSRYFGGLADRLGSSGGASAQSFGKSIEGVARGKTYLEALCELRKMDAGAAPLQHLTLDVGGARLVKPLSVRESVEAIVREYNSQSRKSKRLRFLKNGFDTCSAVAFDRGGFKIIPVSDALCRLYTLGEEQGGLDVDVASLSGSFLQEGDGVYGAGLNKAQVMDHPGWRALFEDDVLLLKEFRDIIFSESGKDEGMAFNLPAGSYQGVLRPVYINNLANAAQVSCDVPLTSPCSFLRLGA